MAKGVGRAAKRSARAVLGR